MSALLVKITNASIFIPGQLPRELLLQNINWDIFRGRHCLLSGLNGSGKSTLLKFIHGDLWAAAGSICWRSGSRLDESRIIARQLTGLVSPHIQAFCQIHAWDVPALSLLAGARESSPYSFFLEPDEALEKEIWDIADELGALPLLAMRLPELSQGQLRLALICRELLRKPELLLLDEWSDGLDDEHQRLAARAFERRADSITFIFASHRKDAIPEWVKERRYLAQGHIYSRCPEPGICEKAVAPVSQKNLFSPPANGRPIYELCNASVYIDRKPVLKNIHWEMQQGEHWLITGANGSGKSTFLRLLAGDEFVHADGSISYWSPKLGRPPESLAEKRQSISLVSDLGQALYTYDLTALELVLSGHENSTGLYRELEKVEIDWARLLIREFFPNDQPEIESRLMSRLSSGQLRRLFLARALVCKPDVLLLDEPCSGLDVASRLQFVSLIARLGTAGLWRFKPAIVMVSHRNEDIPHCLNRRGKLMAGNLFVQNI